MNDKINALFEILQDKNNFSEPWKNYILKNDGNPLQKDIYELLIRELVSTLESIRKTDSLSPKDSNTLHNTERLPESIEEKIDSKIAQIYAYQIILNKRIGRFFYNPDYLDKTLMHNVKTELIHRSKQYAPKLLYIERYFKLYPHDYKDRAFKKFKISEEYKLLLDNDSKPVIGKPANIFNKYKKKYKVNKFDGSYEKRDQITSLLNSFGDFAHVLLGPGDTRRFLKLRKFPENIDTKDILYIIAIAFAMDIDDFITLKQIASEYYQDTSRFEENKFDNRDTMIIAIIRNVKDWYWQTIHEIASELLEAENSAELEEKSAESEEKRINELRYMIYKNAKTDLEWKKKVVLGVLTRVDKIIDENGFCQKNYDKLLLHNFLIRFNAYCPYINENKYYDKVYQNWEKDSTSEPRIFDNFYQQLDRWAKDVEIVKSPKK